MNTASRMESTGLPNRIQVSKETADLLTFAGKTKWLLQRKDQVNAKGKGSLQTFWLTVGSNLSSSSSNLNGLGDDDTSNGAGMDFSSKCLNPGTISSDEKTQRLVNYNVDILARLLHQIVVRRAANPPRLSTREMRKSLRTNGGLVLDEVEDILALPPFDPSTYKNSIDPDSIMLSPRVHAQLEMFVTKIASLYRENPFHNFEHASHVTM